MSARRARRVAGAVAALGVPLGASLGASLGAWEPAAAQPAPPAAVAAARQLVVVVARDWGATTGTLHRYERARPGARWRLVEGGVPVVLGRSGLGWGVGQSAAPLGAPAKREGDGRAPAGVFPLLHAFGIDAFAPVGSGLPLVRLAPGTVCVDDPASPLYNTVADSAAAARARWASAERMRDVTGYRSGVVVAYNGARTAAGGVRLAAAGAPARSGAGSCIFLHGWDGPDRPTAGCTAMAPDVARALATWADAERRPVLVQLPLGVYAELRGAWALP